MGVSKKMLMRREGTYKVVTEDPPTPVDTAWDKMDELAHTSIGLLVEPSQYVHIENATTAREAWDALHEHHKKATVTNAIFLFRKLFRTVLPEGGNMGEHLADLIGTTNKLAAQGE